MAIYSQSQVTSVATTAAPSFDIRSSAANSFRLMEYAINIGAATTSTYGLGRPSNDASVVQSSPLSVISENPNDPLGQSTSAVAWSTAPTVPSLYLRRGYIVNAVGAGIIWTFPRGLIAAPSRGLVMWNITVNSNPTHVWLIVDE